MNQDHSCRRSGRICWLAAAFLLAGQATVGSAEIYRWVDDDGKVHYSDREPIQTGNEVENVDVDAASSTVTRTPAGAGFAATPQVATRTSLTFDGNGEPRTVRLDKIIIDLERDTGGKNVVGRNYRGIGCDQAVGGGLVWSQGRAAFEGRGLRQAFKRQLRDRGFAVIDDGAVLFAGQERQAADLQLAAVITEIQLNSCVEEPGATEERIAAYLRVAWKVFDPLTRVMVFEGVSEGSHRDSYPRSEPNNARSARAQAFRNATSNLLANRDFVAVLSEAPASTATPAGTAAPADLSLAYGDGEQEFVDVVDALKRGTVTVRSPAGHGSGFVVDGRGYVLTNAHVVAGSERVLVITDTAQVPARIVRSDPKRDVALIEADRSLDAGALTLASEPIGTGHGLYIIGTPLDESLSHTVTGGIVSAERLIEGQRFLQTDAAINPGNSGGPVFSRAGEVVGMTVSGIFTRDGASANINFFIPIDDVLAALELTSDT